MTNDNHEPYRLMAEQLWQWAAVPLSYDCNDTQPEKDKEDWISEIAEAIRDHTVVADAIRNKFNVLISI